jgi:SAM-dependent methyltransferase
MTGQFDWPIAFFDDDYLRMFRPLFTEERTRAEVDFIESSLALPRGSAVLDLACGVGRHAIGMALRGHRVTGLDFNAHYLELAAADARRAGADVRWVTGDMRTFAYDREFAGVYSYFTSFGYFSDPENEQVIARIARALEPGGRLLIDMANRDWILTHPQHRSWTQRDDGALLMEESTLDLRTSRVIQRQTLIEPENGPRVTKEFNLRVYTCGELSALLGRHGFGVVNIWGGVDGREYSTESRRLILLAALGTAKTGG